MLLVSITVMRESIMWPLTVPLLLAPEPSNRTSFSDSVLLTNSLLLLNTILNKVVPTPAYFVSVTAGVTAFASMTNTSSSAKSNFTLLDKS